MRALQWMLLTAAGALLGAEMLAWFGPLQRFLLRRAAAALPPQHRERYLEEWINELETLPAGPLTRLRFAVWLFLRRGFMIRELGGQTWLSRILYRIKVKIRGGQQRPLPVTVDDLANLLRTRMVIYESGAVALFALAMFVIWSGPGNPWGTVIVLAVGFVVIGRVWIMPSRELLRVPSDKGTNPNRAAEAMATLANKTMKTLIVPTVVGFVATLLSSGWNPVFAGALLSIAGFAFFGPSRTRLTAWRDEVGI